ncbi:MAG: hypothetical protein A2V64_03175 [Bacteroidetes bacterium RBG_13_43_22]|nr:MAG: hypothetical protein A2V64_03175 [Bacteroidetes bacterium RBG_13_43_22]
MKRIIAVFMLPVVLAGLVCITSCKGKGDKEQKKIELDQVQTLEQQMETNVDSLPTSAEVIKMLTDLEVGYIFGISNPVENTKKYFSSQARAVNLGVYGADLSYATLYNIQQAVLDYLSAIRSLSAELNMSQIYDETLYDRIKQNFDYKDKLVEVLSEAFDKTYAYLSENEQQPLALLVVGGAWVEGMYLTTHVSEAAYQVAGISKNLLEQKKSFELYLEITKPYMNDPVVGDFVRKLDPIKIVYDGLTTSLTEKNIVDITKAIEGIRGMII